MWLVPILFSVTWFLFFGRFQKKWRKETFYGISWDFVGEVRVYDVYVFLILLLGENGRYENWTVSYFRGAKFNNLSLLFDVCLRLVGSMFIHFYQRPTAEDPIRDFFSLQFIKMLMGSEPDCVWVILSYTQCLDKQHI